MSRRKAAREEYETEEQRHARLKQKMAARTEAKRTNTPLPDWGDDETTDLFGIALDEAKAAHAETKSKCDAAVERWSDVGKKIAADG